METRLNEGKANIIRNAIINDGTFCGTPEWCESHHVERGEFLTLLEYGVRLAAMYDWKDVNTEVGSVDVELTFVKHSGKVGQDEETWTVFAPQSDTSKILLVAEGGAINATLTPKQMPLPLEGMGVFDRATGEVLA